MKKVLISLMLVLSSFNLAKAEDAKEIYQTGTLLNLETNSYRETSYMSNGSSYSSGSANAVAYGNMASAFGNSRTSGYATITPFTRVINSYFFTIKIQDLTYVTRFTPKWRSEIDTNWVIGKPIEVRLNKKQNRMYIKKPGSGELKTRILKIIS